MSTSQTRDCISYVYVSDSPYFAKTGANGEAILTGLPAGEYTVRAWHPRLVGKEEATERKLTIPHVGTVESAWEIAPSKRSWARRRPSIWCSANMCAERSS